MFLNNILMTVSARSVLSELASPEISGTRHVELGMTFGHKGSLHRALDSMSHTQDVLPAQPIQILHAQAHPVQTVHLLGA